MSDEYVNLRIRRSPSPDPNVLGIPATERVWLLDHSETRKGARPLEPQDIVRLEKDFAKSLLKSNGFDLEITTEPANRELYIEGNWKASSLFYSTEDTEEVEAEKEGRQARLSSLQPDPISRLTDLNVELQMKIADLTKRLDKVTGGNKKKEPSNKDEGESFDNFLDDD